MDEQRSVTRRGWKQLWCVPQVSRERARDNDWNRLEINAIGSAWGRGVAPVHPDGVQAWSSTIVAELTR